MALANPLWGAPRIHGELLTLRLLTSIWRFPERTLRQ